MNETVLSPAPLAIGRFIQQGRQVLVPVSFEELDRARQAMLAIFRTYHFRTGRAVLSTSLFNEGLHFMPIERAASSYGLVVTSADASVFDAARVESAVRRFDTAAVIGVNGAVLDGLAALGFDPLQVFGQAVVWARGDAHERLAGLAHRRRMVVLGPAVAMECAVGDGAHVDRMAWTVELDGGNDGEGEVLLSSRLPAAGAAALRALPHRRARPARLRRLPLRQRRPAAGVVSAHSSLSFSCRVSHGTF